MVKRKIFAIVMAAVMIITGFSGTMSISSYATDTTTETQVEETTNEETTAPEKKTDSEADSEKDAISEKESTSVEEPTSEKETTTEEKAESEKKADSEKGSTSEKKDATKTEEDSEKASTSEKEISSDYDKTIVTINVSGNGTVGFKEVSEMLTDEQKDAFLDKTISGSYTFEYPSHEAMKLKFEGDKYVTIEQGDKYGIDKIFTDTAETKDYEKYISSIGKTVVVNVKFKGDNGKSENSSRASTEDTELSNSTATASVSVLPKTGDTYTGSYEVTSATYRNGYGTSLIGCKVKGTSGFLEKFGFGDISVECIDHGKPAPKKGNTGTYTLTIVSSNEKTGYVECKLACSAVYSGYQRLKSIDNFGKKLVGYIKLYKSSTDSRTEESVYSSTYSLKGATYGVYTKSSHKSDDLIKKITTANASGRSETEALPIGTCYLYELSAAKNYTMLASNDTRKVYKVTIEYGACSVPDVYDKPEYGKIKIKKTSSSGVVKGFKFRIWSKAKIDGESVYDQTFTTDEDGVILTTSKSKKLLYGTYYIQEQLTDAQKAKGYKQAAKETVTLSSTSWKTVKIYNDIPNGDLTIYKKTNVENGEVTGFNFRVQCRDLNFDKTVTITDTTTIDGETVGVINLQNLKAETYYVTEVLTDEQKKEGYQTPDAQSVQVGKTQNKAYVTFTNNKKPSIKIVKTTDAGTVEGFVFNIYDGAVIYDDYNDPDIKESYLLETVTTNAKGEALATNLNTYSSSSYFLVEEVLTDAQIEAGYKTQSWKRVLAYVNTTTTVNFANTHNTYNVNLKKTSDTGFVNGFKFTIDSVDGTGTPEYHHSDTTGADGTITFTGVMNGTYRISESLNTDQIKDGWQQPEAKTIVVKDKDQTVNFHNTYVKEIDVSNNSARIKKTTNDGGSVKGFKFRVTGTPSSNMLPSKETLIEIINSQCTTSGITVKSTEISNSEYSRVINLMKTSSIGDQIEVNYTVTTSDNTEFELSATMTLGTIDSVSMSGANAYNRVMTSSQSTDTTLLLPTEQDLIDALNFQSRDSSVTLSSVKIVNYDYVIRDIQNYANTDHTNVSYIASFSDGSYYEYYSSIFFATKGSVPTSGDDAYNRVMLDDSTDSGVPMSYADEFTWPGIPSATSSVTIFSTSEFTWPGIVNGPITREGVTDSNGDLLIGNMPLGTFTVTELLTDEQKKMYTTPASQTISLVTDGQTANVAFQNIAIERDVSIIKTSEDGNISGIEFTITGKRADGTEIAPIVITTDSNGLISEKLYAGTYTITETVDTTKYMKQDPQTVTITENSPAEISVAFHNDLVKVKIKKTDITGENEIPGATMSIRNGMGDIVTVNGEELQWVSTGTEKEISGLVGGKTYILREDSAPNGYYAADDIYFTVGEDSTVTMKNALTDTKINKCKEGGTTQLAGVTLSIRDSETEEIITLNGEKLQWTTTSTPKDITGLTEGNTYILREDSTLDGYVKADDMTFTVSANTTVTMQNYYTRVCVYKMDANIVNGLMDFLQPLYQTAYGETETLDWENLAYYFLVGDSRDDNWENFEQLNDALGVSVSELVGYCFESDSGEAPVMLGGATLSIRDAETGEIAPSLYGSQWETLGGDEDFEQVISGLTAGKEYYLHEDEPPEGYKQADDISFTVSGDSNENYIFMLDEMTTTKIYKLDGGNPTAAEPVEGAVLNLRESDNSIMPVTTTYKSLDIDPDTCEPSIQENTQYMVWTTTSEPYIAKGLKQGVNYYIEETTVPDGYKIPDDAVDTYNKVEFMAGTGTITVGPHGDGSGTTVREDDPAVGEDVDGFYTGYENSVIVVNQSDMGSFRFQKTNSITDEPVEGAKFELYKVNSTAVNNGLFTQMGYIEVIQNESNYTRTIDTSDYGQSFGLGDLVAEATSDDTGIVRFDKLKNGYYFLTEVNAADGYYLSSYSWLLNVTDDNKYNNINGGVTVLNHGGSHQNDFDFEDVSLPTLANDPYTMTFSFTKVDAETGEPLEGAEFALYRYKDENQSESVVERSYGYAVDEYIDAYDDPVTAVSGEDGKVTFKNLKAAASGDSDGQYYRLVETKAPKMHTLDKYCLSEWVIKLDLTSGYPQIFAHADSDNGGDLSMWDTTDSKNLSLSNEAYSLPALPTTGSIGTREIILIGITTMMIGAVVYRLTRRRRKA